MLTTLTLLLALQAPLEQEAPTLIDDKPAVEQGKLGGIIGASTGCLAGTGAPSAVLGGGYALISYMYSQAAIGACVGFGPAFLAIGTASSMCGAGVCLPPIAAGGTVAGAMYGAQLDGRDPTAALWGGMPGLVLAALSSATMITGLMVGTVLGLGGIGVAAIIVGIGAVAGIISIPCTMLGSGITDVVVAHNPEEKPREPLAGTGKPAMKF